MGGRDCEGGGMRSDKFFKLRARRFGESGRRFAGAGSSLEASDCIVDRGATSTGRIGGVNFG